MSKLIKHFRTNRTLRVAVLDGLLAIAIIVIILAAGSPARVEGLSVAELSYDAVTLRWSEARNASGYHVYRSDDGGDYEYIGTSLGTEYKDEDLVTGRTYEYSVAAYNGINRGPANRENAVTAVPELDTPELRGTTAKGKIQLSYDAVDGAAGYEIYRNGKKIADQAADKTEFTDKDAATNKKYTYEVKAYRYKDDPVYSSASNDVRLRLAGVSSITAEIFGDDLIFTWDRTDEYASYELYQGKKLLDTLTDTEYSIRGFDPSMTYKMKLVGISEDGKKRSPENKQTFVIDTDDMSNQAAIDAACDWGVSIAADNSFQYGTGARAHRCGCYFCGTNVGPNMNIKGTSLVDGHSYEKTYCCNPFVHACFAHGAGDAAMLAACQRGGSIAMTEKSFTRYGDWVNAGKPSMSDLRRGDVLVASPTMGSSKWNHVSLYIGGGQVVQAIEKGWTDESICVSNLRSERYAKYDFVMRYTGTGGGSMYTVREIDKNDQG